VGAAVREYSIEIKRSAQKELDGLDDAVFNRVDRKLLALAEDPGHPVPRSCKATKTFGAFASAIGVSST
jgi:mRNA-degrading endonuclease RelE of RelBE toxin-antitoxin system